MKTKIKIISLFSALILASITIFGFKANVKSGSSRIPTVTTYTVTCRLCNGSGKCARCLGAGSSTCLMCSGTGKSNAAVLINAEAKIYAAANNIAFTPVDETCSNCNGSGKVNCIYCNGTGVCPECKGTGEVPR